MTPAGANPAVGLDVAPIDLGKYRVSSQGDDPAVLADVYQDIVNMAVWQRELNSDLKREVTALVASPHALELSMTVTPESVRTSLGEALGSVSAPAFCKDVAYLVDMFCSLLGFEWAGLRVTVLSQAMCPRFHVDNVPCRFVTTYHGAGTDWLPHHAVDRSKLGRGSHGLSDKDSGLYTEEDAIRQLDEGDVALLKGELWAGNENAGLVHRSPAVPAGESRLLLTLDVISH